MQWTSYTSYRSGRLLHMQINVETDRLTTRKEDCICQTQSVCVHNQFCTRYLGSWWVRPEKRKDRMQQWILLQVEDYLWLTRSFLWTWCIFTLKNTDKSLSSFCGAISIGLVHLKAIDGSKFPPLSKWIQDNSSGLRRPINRHAIFSLSWSRTAWIDDVTGEEHK